MGNCCGDSEAKDGKKYEITAEEDSNYANLETTTTYLYTDYSYGDMLKPIPDPSLHRDLDIQSVTTFSDTPQKYKVSESSLPPSVSKKEIWKNQDEGTMEREFNIKVPINDEKRTKSPFHSKMPSDHVVAVFLSFVGRRARVCQLLQHMSKGGRAYCVENDGFKDILVPNLPNPIYLKHMNEQARQVIYRHRQEQFERKSAYIKVSKVTMQMLDVEGMYSGEINSKGEAHGVGFFICNSGNISSPSPTPRKTYKGIFRNNKPIFCKSTSIARAYHTILKVL